MLFSRQAVLRAWHLPGFAVAAMSLVLGSCAGSGLGAGQQGAVPEGFNRTSSLVLYFKPSKIRVGVGKEKVVKLWSSPNAPSIGIDDQCFPYVTIESNGKSGSQGGLNWSEYDVAAASAPEGACPIIAYYEPYSDATKLIVKVK